MPHFSSYDIAFKISCLKQLEMNQEWTNGLKTLTEYECMMTHEPMDQDNALESRIYGPKCLVHHVDNRLECTIKHEMTDHEPMNHGAWTKDLDCNKYLGSMDLNGKIECI